MGRVQVLAIAVCTTINVVDGFDVLASAVTAFGIGGQWALQASEFGVLFSSGLAGMTAGALLLSPAADLWGRRTTVLLCLCITASGMLAAAGAVTFWGLILARVATGIGVGAMLPAINTVVAECASDRRRDLAVCVQAAGFPLGGVLGGVAVYLASDSNWRWVYLAGSGLSIFLILVVLRWLPESVDFLLVRQPPGALAKVNDLLGRLDLPLIACLPAKPAKPNAARSSAIRDLGLGPRAFTICAAYFLLMFSFYFLASWTPKLLADYGFSTRAGVSGSVFMSLGGVVGDLAFAVLTLVCPAQRLGQLFLVSCFLAVTLLATLPLQLGALVPVAFLIGFLLFGSIASLYAIVPQLFPTRVRAGGTGLALGMGRIGATAGPYVGGLLIAHSWNRTSYLLVMSMPLIACSALVKLLGKDLRRGEVDVHSVAVSDRSSMGS